MPNDKKLTKLTTATIEGRNFTFFFDGKPYLTVDTKFTECEIDALALALWRRPTTDDPVQITVRRGDVQKLQDYIIR
jgi:hypothetical protein